MAREEQIKKQADIYTDDASNYTEWSDDGGWSSTNDIELVEKAFIEGAKWADEHPKSPWISVKDDLPCNHEELLIAKCKTKEVFTLGIGNSFNIDYMLKVNGKWRWFSYENSKFWMPIPEPPKMGRKIGEIFEIDGVKLQVEEGSIGCVGCYFDEDKECFDYWDITGECHWSARENKKGIIFKEVK